MPLERQPHVSAVHRDPAKVVQGQCDAARVAQLAVPRERFDADPFGDVDLRQLRADPDVIDERVVDRFEPDPGGYEGLMYGFSVLHCLPSGMCGHHPAGTGTVMRTDTLRSYAQAAGFGDVDVLPIEHPLFRFYRLR